jgi:sialic acid synthase SpsE
VKYVNGFKINNREVTIDAPVYFIADIASNHDGDLEKAKELIWIAKEAGADAAKFQHFKANKIVSDYGFRNLSGKLSHQASWSKSVYEVYEQYECNRQWTEELVKTANDAQIDFMTTPYDEEAVRLIDDYVPAYKIGSGDITWTEFIEFIAQREKPVLLATGASDMLDVERAVQSILKHNQQIALLQCNTNYTGSLDNLHYVNLNVLKAYALKYPGMLLGLSDHTPGHATVLGAIALGARIIEKHLTNDNNRIGPDHAFSMNPRTWRDMIDRSRELEAALGDGIKRIEENERDASIVQRRSIRFRQDLPAGHTISVADVESLRPAPVGSLEPYRTDEIIGKKLAVFKKSGDSIYLKDLEG